MASPEAAYQAGPGGGVEADRGFYRQLAELPGRELVEEFVVPIRSGRAWEVPAGYLCRIVAVDGPQVGDLNLWNRHDPRERLWAARTRQLQAAHVSTFDRLWSTLPFLRPLVTITSDSLAGYGVDGDGGRVHDLLGTRCDPYVHRMLSGADFDFCCHSNLTRAVLPYGLTEFDVHDVLNVFQCTGLNDEDRYFMKTCPAQRGDHFEFSLRLICCVRCPPALAVICRFRCGARLPTIRSTSAVRWEWRSTGRPPPYCATGAARHPRRTATCTASAFPSGASTPASGATRHAAPSRMLVIFDRALATN